MKVIVWLTALLVLASCTTADVQPDPIVTQATSTAGVNNAEILYGYRCKGCHEPATPGAPDRKELATYEQKEIVDALSKGAMKQFAPGLTKQDMRDLAAFLTVSSAKSRSTR